MTSTSKTSSTLSSVLIALGSNLGDRVTYLRRAVDALAPDVRVVRISSVRETEPLDSPEFSSRATGLHATDLEDIERATIERVFSQVNGDKALAGKMLGISRATLYRKLKRYHIGGGREEPPQSTTLQ